MPDPSPRSRRRLPATIPYAALAKGQIDPDTAVELADRITGQPVRVSGRVLGKVLDARADADGIHVTLDLDDVFADTFEAMTRSVGVEPGAPFTFSGDLTFGGE